MALSYRNGKLKHGYINELSVQFGVTRLTVSTIWKDVREQLKAGKVINVARKYKGSKATRFIDVEKVKNIELKDRMCLKDLAFGLGLPITTVWRLVKKGEMKSHTSDIKPSLTAQNKITRLHWVLSKISASSLGGNLIFDAMYDVVHIDEKHFYLTRVTTSGSNGSSKNREKGTLEVKPIESITKEVVKQCLLEKVIPAIKAKWPLNASGKIWIQQDNAKPYISPKDLDFLEVAKSDGFDMELICQPPNSPDLNILDLGFFRSIQSLQHKKSSKSILQLVDVVGRAYDEIDIKKLKFVWVSLHACMNEILRDEGGNSYPIPHVGKKRLDRVQLLENKVKPDMVCLERALHVLENMNNDTQEPSEVQTATQPNNQQQ
ncbi:uncharacterized protein LOC141629867 [Silene latifolia]|uniref:uncharacterized protein LOC141629867 n=1 Tax=Silene latifolia TaxID=37657 RepID=UPI003D77DEDC